VKDHRHLPAHPPADRAALGHSLARVPDGVGGAARHPRYSNAAPAAREAAQHARIEGGPPKGRTRSRPSRVKGIARAHNRVQAGKSARGWVEVAPDVPAALAGQREARVTGAAAPGAAPKKTKPRPRRFKALVLTPGAAQSRPAVVRVEPGELGQKASNHDKIMSGDLPTIILWLEGREAQRAEYSALAKIIARPPIEPA